ncbi:hypothetical protein SLE2022_098920 [Rubroshorea leprosula]
MGRSSTCFKIIACGSETAENDDGQVPENKSSRGWSFRKRSERHRVLSNTVITETPSEHKEISASVGLNFQPPDSSAVPEKASTQTYVEEKPEKASTQTYVEEKLEKASTQTYVEEKPEKASMRTYVEEKLEKASTQTYVEEKPQSLAPLPVQQSEPITVTSESDKDVVPEVSVVIIQTAVRGFLAQRDLVKRKNVVKLQAAVRGHLVRKHAVGTLRCVQAIVKMQVLVRARLARQSLEGIYAEKKSDGKPGKDNLSLKQDRSVTRPDVTYTSLEKLLSNRFARQLLESTTKSKPINIKCDPLKPNSAWNWLERWMSVSVAEQSPKPEAVNDQPETEKNEDVAPPVDERAPSEASSESSGLKSDVRETIVPSESEESLITYDADKVKFEVSQLTPLETDNLQQAQLESTSTSEQKETLEEAISNNETSMEISSKRNQTIQSDANSETEPPFKLETENEQPKRSMKRLASDELETEGKKYVFGSRKASNPAFIAAQTKFEEMGATAYSGRSIISSYQDIELNVDAISSGAETDSSRAKELSNLEPPVHNNPVIHHGGSECGTELSITSTLDSPDRSEVGTTECEQGEKILGQENSSSNTTKDLDEKSYNMFSIPLSNEFKSVTDKPEKIDGMDKSGNSDEVVGSPESPQVEQEPEKTTADPQRALDPETGRQASPEASPRSHMTVPESQGTPSSQVSVKAKKSKTDKSNQKRKSLSAGKSPANDYGARSSVEQLPKDQKSGKRRNSFGSTRPESIDQEPRDSSSSSNSIPHFMQATESARAKVQANNSPRSSPDLHDRDIYIKKRHSLPGANGRQGSPRIQRSMSQAQQGAKGNGTPPLHERKWQR